MKYLFQNSPDDSDFMQGDIITNNTKENKIYGMVLNADCDIAQGKWGRNFSWIEIIPALEYLNIIWSDDQCQKILKSDQILQAIKSVNQYLNKKNSTFTPLTPEKLCEWLREYKSSADFFTAIGKSPSKNEQVELEMLMLASGTNCENMTAGDRLRKIWSLQEKKDAYINESLKKALTKSDGFPDFFLLPDLQSQEGTGFVILLRIVNSIPRDNLYKNIIDARINGNENSFYRFNRLADNIRFLVVQKMAFLFSRIGTNPYFEDECSASVELVSELYKSSKESKK